MKAIQRKTRITADGLTCDISEAWIDPKIKAEVIRQLKQEEELYIEEETMKIIDKNAMLTDAVVLLTLHEVFKFGKDRLRKFFFSTQNIIDYYYKHYGCGYSENERIDTVDNRNQVLWEMLKDLKSIGVSLEEWTRNE